MTPKGAGQQLLRQAFLQRFINVINSGGYIITREYELGNKRTDLLIEWYTKPNDSTTKQKVIIECKLIRKSLEKTLEDGLEQVLEYKDKCGAEEAHFILFDKRENRTWEEKIFYFERAYKGTQVHV